MVHSVLFLLFNILIVVLLASTIVSCYQRDKNVQANLIIMLSLESIEIDHVVSETML